MDSVQVYPFFVIIGFIALVSVLVSSRKDSKTFAVFRVAINAFTVVLAILGGSNELALIWVVTTVLSLIYLPID